MNTPPPRTIVIAASSAAMFLLITGCASMRGDGEDSSSAPRFHLYSTFDNSRDTGPGYLVGPPGQQMTYGGRLDGGRRNSSNQ